MLQTSTVFDWSTLLAVRQTDRATDGRTGDSRAHAYKPLLSRAKNVSELHWSDRPLHWDLPFICQSTSSSGGASKQLNRNAAVTGTTLGLLSTMCTVCSVVIADRALRAVFSTLSVCYPTPMSIMQIFYRPTPIIGRFLVHP